MAACRSVVLVLLAHPTVQSSSPGGGYSARYLTSQFDIVALGDSIVLQYQLLLEIF